MSDRTISDPELLSALGQVRYPGFPHDIVKLGMVAQAAVDGRTARVALRLPGGPNEVPRELARAVAERLSTLGLEIDLRLADRGAAVTGDTTSRAGRGSESSEERAALPGVRSIIAVSSAKGGVGKSTIATNLACAFARLSFSTGLLDADVYGPSLPILMGTDAKPTGAGGNRFHPVERFGVRCISMGFFLDESSPVIWRGPMVTGLLRQFLSDVVWGELDVLVLDLPPGTGDAQLTLVQQVRLSGAVIVTTPQEVALRDVVRGIGMFRQVQVPILGVVENMTSFVCPDCGEEEKVFGEGGGAAVAELAGAPLLAQLPLDPRLARESDAGRPAVIAEPTSTTAATFIRIAQQLAERVGLAAGADAMASA